MSKKRDSTLSAPINSEEMLIDSRPIGLREWCYCGSLICISLFAWIMAILDSWKVAQLDSRSFALRSVAILSAVLTWASIRYLVASRKEPFILNQKSGILNLGVTFFTLSPIQIRLNEIIEVRPIFLTGVRQLILSTPIRSYQIAESRFSSLRDFYFVVSTLAKGQHVSFKGYPRRSVYWKNAWRIVLGSTLFILFGSLLNWVFGQNSGSALKGLVYASLYFLTFGPFTYLQYRRIQSNPDLDLEMEDFDFGLNDDPVT